MSDIKITRLTPAREAHLRRCVADVGEYLGAMEDVAHLLAEIDALRAQVASAPTITMHGDDMAVFLAENLTCVGAEPAWSEEPPTEKGWYWARDPHPCVVYVTDVDSEELVACHIDSETPTPLDDVDLWGPRIIPPEGP